MHAFLVPIRDEDGIADARRHASRTAGARPASTASTTAGSGSTGVRVPRENLLDRYGDVAADGTYSSPIENQTERFFTMLGTLVRGRISVAGGAGSATKVALAIAVRYAERAPAVRRARAATARSRVLDYLAHQRKLLPALATTYALHFAQDELVATLHDVPRASRRRRPTSDRAARARGAGRRHQGDRHLARHRDHPGPAARPAAARATSRRTGCPALKADTDVFTTFEGDNTVLLQLVAKGLLTGYRDALRRARHARHRAVRRRPGVRDGRRADSARAARRSGCVDAAPGRDEEQTCSTAAGSVELFE